MSFYESSLILLGKEYLANNDKNIVVLEIYDVVLRAKTVVYIFFGN